MDRRTFLKQIAVVSATAITYKHINGVDVPCIESGYHYITHNIAFVWGETKNKQAEFILTPLHVLNIFVTATNETELVSINEYGTEGLKTSTDVFYLAVIEVDQHV